MEASNMLSQYTIQANIGSGSYGQIYKVIDNRTQQVVVMKQIMLQNLSDEREKTEALNEILIMKQLSHPSIVKYFDSFIDKNSLYIIMEYAPGGDLNQFIKKRKEQEKPLSRDEIWNLLMQICEGLNYLHKKRILHRDIKSRNIFLNEEGQIKIGDLGLGRCLGPQSTYAYSAVGTPLYFSPELCEGKHYNEKSDIWALGCLVYELATLRPPFMATNQIALAKKIISNQPPSLPKFYGTELNFLVSKMLEKDMEKRPSISHILNYSPIRQRMTDRMLEEMKDLNAKRTEELGEVKQKCGQLEREKGEMTNELNIMKENIHSIKKQARSYQQRLESEVRLLREQVSKHKTHSQYVLGEMSVIKSHLQKTKSSCRQLQSQHKDDLSKLVQTTNNQTSRTVEDSEVNQDPLPECLRQLQELAKSRKKEVIEALFGLIKKDLNANRTQEKKSIGPENIRPSSPVDNNKIILAIPPVNNKDAVVHRVEASDCTPRQDAPLPAPKLLPEQGYHRGFNKRFEADVGRPVRRNYAPKSVSLDAYEMGLCSKEAASKLGTFRGLFAWKKMYRGNARALINSPIVFGANWQNDHPRRLETPKECMLIACLTNASLHTPPKITSFQARCKGESRFNPLNFSTSTASFVQVAASIHPGQLYLLDISSSMTSHRQIEEFMLNTNVADPFDQVIVLNYNRKFLELVAISPEEREALARTTQRTANTSPSLMKALNPSPLLSPLIAIHHPTPGRVSRQLPFQHLD